MFVVSMKVARSRVAAFAAALVMLVVVTAALAKSPAVATGAAPGGDDARVALLRELGYAVGEQWTAVQEITIPAEFDAAYTAYNEMQKEAGYDLTPYRGQRIKCYTYSVPGESVQAHVYEYGGRVIGGDIAGTGAAPFHSGLIPAPEQGESHGTTG